MHSARLIPLAAAITAVLVAAPARPQGTPGDKVLYALASKSAFEWGCFAPCACPVFFRGGVQGTFVLTKTGSDPLFDHYAVSEVKWRVPDAATPSTITGSGTYRRGGEFALQEQLTLDLSFDGGGPQRFDSGLVPPRAPWPRLDVSISVHGATCFDSVVTVVAEPQGVAFAEGDRGAGLTAVPSLFQGTTEVAFTLPREGGVDLRVFDAAGREARCLVREEWLASGRHRRVWDGRLAGGLEAPAGLYLLRLGTPEAVHTRPVVKLR